MYMQCGPEYKLSGLYVVDSIVRQSRHQFGTEKDVFGPRFSKNFEKTFKNIFLCTPSDQVAFLPCNYSAHIVINFLSAQDNESSELMAEE